MKYCEKCLQPDTRPGESFNKENICIGCQNHNRTEIINYEKRYETLKKIINSHQKRKQNQFFECIIGVSGGKDSTRQAVWVREKLNLRPLLISFVWPPEQINERGAKNISNLIENNFDLVSFSASPQTFKKLIRKSFLQYGNWAKPTELALYSTIPKMAINYNISLIFNGEDQGQKEIQTKGTNEWDNNNIRNLNTLDGGDNNWIKKELENENKIIPYDYPSEKEFKKKGIQIVDLGWFIEDWSFKMNGISSICYGLEPRTEDPLKTGDPSFVSSLDEDWVPINQLLKYYKYGYGKATDYYNEEIREGRITREEAIPLIEAYDGQCSVQLIEQFCKYIQISHSEFQKTLLKFINKNLFKVEESNKIIKLFKVGD